MSHDMEPNAVTSGGDVPTPVRSGGREHRGRHPRAGRGDGRNHRFHRRQTRFEGREESLKGHIYDIASERNMDQFIKTTKEIENYVGRTYKSYTGDFITGIQDLTLADPTPPEDPDPTNVLALERWKRDSRRHEEQMRLYRDFRAGLYSLVLGQCTEALRDKVESHHRFQEISQNGIELLKVIKSLSYAYEEETVKLADSMVEIKERYFEFKQGKYMTLQRYYELFKSLAELAVQLGVTIMDHGHAVKVAEKARGPGSVPNAAEIRIAQNEAIAIRFVRGTNDKHNAYYRHLRNAYLDGEDFYPPDLQSAYNVLQRRDDGRSEEAVPRNDGLNFLQNGTETDNTTEGTMLVTAGRNGRSFPHIECRRCGQRGHYANQCPTSERSNENNNINSSSSEAGRTNGTQMTQFVLSQAQSGIPNTWILLDSQSTVDLFNNPSLVSNVRVATTVLDLHCNAGTKEIRTVGDLAGYGTVWFDNDAIANVLSLKRVAERFHVRYDSDENRFVVTKPDGTSFEFIQSEAGLYYLDTNTHKQQNVDLVGSLQVIV